MKLSENGIKLIKSFEGCRLQAYADPVGIWTIGYGNTFYKGGEKVKEGDVISKETADALFGAIYPRYEQIVNNAVSSKINQNQFDALVSFVYNVGGGNFQKSTLLQKVNINPNDGTIRDEFLKYNKAGGKQLMGLTRRREAEANLYITPHAEQTFEDFLFNKFPLWKDKDTAYFNVSVKQMIDLQREYAEKAI